MALISLDGLGAHSDSSSGIELVDGPDADDGQRGREAKEPGAGRGYAGFTDRDFLGAGGAIFEADYSSE